MDTGKSTAGSDDDKEQTLSPKTEVKKDEKSKEASWLKRFSFSSKPTTFDDSLLKQPKTLKSFCRRGIPDSQRAKAWPRLVHSSVESQRKLEVLYKETLEDLFQDKMPERYFARQVPDFGNPLVWDSRDTLTKSDQSTQQILCVLASTNPELTYCPMLVDLIPLFLLKFNEAETFALLQAMILISKEKQKYLPTSGTHWARNIMAFDKQFEEHIKNVYIFCEQLAYKPSTLFERWLIRFFVSYLPQTFILRIIDCYLNEGYKILYRVGLGIFKFYFSNVKACKTAEELEEKLSYCARHAAGDEAEIFEIMFRLKLRRKEITQHQATPTKDLKIPSAKREIFHIPKFTNGPSELFTYSQLSTLWDWLPENSKISGVSLKTKDAKLLYRGTKDGYNLNTMFSKIGEEKHHIIVIKDKGKAVFGGFFLQSWKPKKKGDDAPQTELDARTFMFSLHPHEEIYRLRDEDTESKSGSLGRTYLPTLQLDVKRARKLARKDKSPTTVLIIKTEVLDNEKYPRVVRRATYNDKDKENPEINLTINLHSFMSPSMTKSIEALNVQLWEKTEGQGEQLIGLISLNLSEIDGKSTKGWFPLRSTTLSSSEEALGELEIDIIYESAQLKEKEDLKKMSPLKDEEKRRIWSSFMVCTFDMIAVADAEGVAFSLNKELATGRSTATLAYSNPPLSQAEESDGRFEVMDVEVWGFT